MALCSTSEQLLFHLALLTSSYYRSLYIIVGIYKERFIQVSWHVINYLIWQFFDNFILGKYFVSVSSVDELEHGSAALSYQLIILLIIIGFFK